MLEHDSAGQSPVGMATMMDTRSLKRMSGPQHEGLGEMRADELRSDRQAGGREAGRDSQSRIA